MSRRYSFESSEDPYSANPPREEARHQQPYQEPPQRQYEQPYQQQYQQPYEQSYQQQYQEPHQQPYQQPSHQSSQPLSQQPHEQPYQQSYQQPYQQSAVNNSIYPGAHPDSAFDRLRAVRRQSQSDNGNIPLQTYPQPINTENPPAPAHRDPQGRYWGQELGYSNSMASNTTPGADNFSEHAGGGIAGIALGVADAHARESGLEALRHTPGYEQPYDGPGARDHVAAPGLDLHDIPSYGAYESLRPTSRIENSQTSLAPLNPAAMPPLSRSPHSFQGSNYSDTPYNRLSRNLDPNMGGIDPNSIEDDGDDGLEYTHHNRGSIQNLTSNAERSNVAPVGAAAAGGVMGTLGGLVGRSVSGNSQYGPVSNPGDSAYNLSREAEKSEWLKSQSSSRKKWKWIIATTAIFLVVAGIVAGVTVPLLMKKNSSSSDSSSDSSGTASGDTTANGDLGTNSAEIQALLNNKDLHKIFPGIDYSPINTQYPDCLSNPPSQNNVTRDLAVLSQLTNVIRLYGTDCNQTQMLLHSIDRLGLNDTVKVWLGVYQDKNVTTNARQLSQMYDILNAYGASPFLGIIIGNEVLFNQYMTEVALETIITGVKTNLTSMGINLPVATSDLGDNWTATLANAVDYVMANVHPFFAGVEASVAASWTWSFWQDKDAAFKTDPTKSIISETGWPSQGGTDCGAATTCTTGSVASIDDMNTFMSTWVCQALANGTNYFWFEAFDEPWKLQYDTAGKEWEDHWGLMDVNRNLKNGVKIPDCGGKTVGPASA